MEKKDIDDERLARYMGGRYGQRGDTRRRYEAAIRACSDIAYLPKTVTDIARAFGHEPETFRLMMKRHYMEVLEERERLRQLLGLNKRPPRGVAEATRQKFEPALELLRKSEMTVRQAAEATGVSLAALQQHIIFYHKDLAQERLMRRAAALDKPRQPGAMTANGSIAHPRGTAAEYYAEAVKMLREHPEMTVKQAALQTGVGIHNLSEHIQRWHRDLMREREAWRRQQTLRRQREAQRKLSRHEQVAQKYAPAMSLIAQGYSYPEIVRQTGLSIDSMQLWMKCHQPALHEQAKANKRKRKTAGVPS